MQNLIKNILTDVKVELSQEFDKNFERKAFFETKWKDRKRHGKGTLMVKSGKLRRSIRAKTGATSVTWTSSEPYASIHNEGGEITVTKKMKRFFWAKYYELGGKIKYKKNGQMSKASTNVSEEAVFYKALALKPVGSKISIPERRFIGNHPKVKQTVESVIKENLNTILKDFKKYFKP